MREIEEKVARSFSLAKQDIIKLQEAFIALSKANKKVISNVEAAKKSNSKLQLRVKKLEEASKKKKKPAKKTLYYATKNGRNFHVRGCPATKKISRANKIIFKSKAKAMKEGFKPCKCVAKK